MILVRPSRYSKNAREDKYWDAEQLEAACVAHAASSTLAEILGARLALRLPRLPRAAVAWREDTACVEIACMM